MEARVRQSVCEYGQIQKETGVGGHDTVRKEGRSDGAGADLRGRRSGSAGESLERIFDQFYRTDEARTHAGNGSGIGLAIVREIVKGHGAGARGKSEWAGHYYDHSHAGAGNR